MHVPFHTPRGVEQSNNTIVGNGDQHWENRKRKKPCWRVETGGTEAEKGTDESQTISIDVMAIVQFLSSSFQIWITFDKEIELDQIDRERNCLVRGTREQRKKLLSLCNPRTPRPTIPYPCLLEA
ncbi:hypothetical protein VNO77_09234 [Canavalia gladiata]|uniref:Uncharacterized protein n=1 Tax=Canavalia gladiata TaxID=3824 RepID=A0AAN9QWX8_CANGL